MGCLSTRHLLRFDPLGRFGRGFSRQNLQQMRQFYLMWPFEPICQTVSGESVTDIEVGRAGIGVPSLPVRLPLPWSAYVRLMLAGFAELLSGERTAARGPRQKLS